MKIKTILQGATVTILACSSILAQEKQLQLKAFITKADGKPLSPKAIVYVEKISAGKLWYRTEPKAVNIKDVTIAAQQAVFISRPADFVAAIELFEDRKYEAALNAFQAIKVKYDAFTDIDNSIPALAGLYELDCYRKLKQYDKLSEAEKVFAKSRYLAKPSFKQQIEIYKLWTAAQDKENFPLIAKQYETKWKTPKLPNYLRAQVEFLYGKALEGLGKDNEALIAFSKAMNADFAASEVLSLEAITASFNLISRDKEVQEIRTLWDKSLQGNKNLKGLLRLKINTMPYMRLLEASALVRIHDKLGLSGVDSIGKAIPLPARYADYGKYTKEVGEKFLQD